ncbi:unnamed protein product [Ceratitis capitata]|uniref:(Mediterranean fruit fly) hypothetical protein n=1 Tax=Ceratitis capitata TaxID=7213 RepID=A0A811V0A6_CERCA|nr:unnamed protein product [Ceratitis capitata]
MCERMSAREQKKNANFSLSQTMNANFEVNASRAFSASGLHSGANYTSKCVCYMRWHLPALRSYADRRRAVRKSAKVVLPFELYAAEVNARQLPQLAANNDPLSSVGEPFGRLAACLLGG